MAKLQRPADQVIDDWFDHQTTRYFSELLKLTRADADRALHDQPYVAETSEHLMADRANLWGIREAFATLEIVFKTESLEELEEEHEEHIGNLPERGSDTDQTGRSGEGD